ncbi:hypothetical protein [Xanthomonas massiliensis]|uniref:hypothetical protein n=1 Tax=Xanthomonas massiliensis TaxID=1720302 RepID=UPI000826FEFC|nr:hypothetical protein [Xanthomonas massiliensis]
MHVLAVIVGGGLLLAVFLLFGWHWSGGAPATRALAAWVFVPVWLVVTLVNLWVGVARAGYPLRGELPILLLVFALPALAAAGLAWRLGR